MSHTYASLAQFKGWVIDNGGTDFGTNSDTPMLLTLEAASRRVEAFCNRSRFGSGFGPRTGTNRYDGNGAAELWFDDDLLTVTSITILDSTAASTSKTPTVDTDYFLQPYDTTPKRSIVLHGGSGSSVTSFTSGMRTVSVAGAWGYAAETLTAAATAAATATSSATSLTVSSGSEFSAGMTLLVDSEQLYVTAVSGVTLTVDRGANGTTAAGHASGSTIAYYRYPRDVVDATIRLAHRRWRAKEAGVTGDFGAGDVGNFGNRDTEFAILRDTVGRFRLFRI